jgi:hypothetical protein
VDMDRASVARRVLPIAMQPLTLPATSLSTIAVCPAPVVRLHVSFASWPIHPPRAPASGSGQLTLPQAHEASKMNAGEQELLDVVDAATRRAMGWAELGAYDVQICLLSDSRVTLLQGANMCEHARSDLSHSPETHTRAARRRTSRAYSTRPSGGRSTPT